MFYKEGSKDYAMVREIQQALNIKVDGQFGPKTTQAVIRFQSDNLIVGTKCSCFKAVNSLTLSL